MKFKKKTKKIKSLIPKNLSINKLNFNPSGLIENTKNKLENYYIKLKKDSDQQALK